jgi:hypothetical protein
MLMARVNALDMILRSTLIRLANAGALTANFLRNVKADALAMFQTLGQSDVPGHVAAAIRGEEQVERFFEFLPEK